MWRLAYVWAERLNQKGALMPLNAPFISRRKRRRFSKAEVRAPSNRRNHDGVLAAHRSDALSVGAKFGKMIRHGESMVIPMLPIPLLNKNSRLFMIASSPGSKTAFFPSLRDSFLRRNVASGAAYAMLFDIGQDHIGYHAKPVHVQFTKTVRDP